MNNPEFEKAYNEQNERDYLANARFGSLVSIPLNLSCSVMDYFMYPGHTWSFLKLRIACGILTSLVWLWCTKAGGPRVIFGVTWFMGPLMMILWMIYLLPDPFSPYYAGLNIILLAMGLISPWTYKQNFIITVFVLAMYVFVVLVKSTPQPLNYILNNSTFLFLTSAFVVLGSRNNLRQRSHEFALRWELDRSRKVVEENNQKLKELDQIKGRFFANISHELRTPLTLMISPLETIIARYSSTLGADATSLLRTMQGNGLRLLKLINDLLDLVRLDSGVLQAKREAVALADFLNGMASAARQVADDKKIQLTVAIAPEVGVAMLDRDKMEKIVLNLQFNALKFTPVGGKVELRVDKEGDELVLRVADTGIGIPERDLPNVFGRFFQVDSSARRKYQGVGIGLALVKEFVELHGGTVKVDSIEGKGTTFTARMPYIVPEAGVVAAPEQKLPALPTSSADDPPTREPVSDSNQNLVPANASAETTAPVPAAESTVSSQEWLANLYHRANLFGTPIVDKSSTSRGNNVIQPVSTGHAATVLVADDQPDMLNFIKSELTSRYNVIPVSDGQQAVDNAAAHQPDIVLLDMMMPEKDGIQACREIRAADATRNTPIVLITAHVDEETKLNALRAGASDFLPKPFSTTELQVRVQNLIQLHKSQRALSEQNHKLATTIEQLKETETQLVQAEKIAGLGRLSAGIIHEINNPLNFAATGLYTLRSKAKLIPDADRDEYAETLKDVEEGVHRVKSIVSDLRTFTHPGSRGMEEVNVQESVTSALRFLSHEWRNKIEVKTDLPDTLVLWADKNKFIQVLINLLQNSLDALRVKEFVADGPAIVISGRTQDGRTVLKVRDNGVGIAPEIMNKIFDPFFTTKDVGQGMGLGLSICYRIVQDYGGQIHVNSEPGAYCEFALEFPATQPDHALQP